ncbi:MAG: hypothetical protein LUO80_03465 [Methylococcaceae bacterium]|nr:hypothetical protein [Methylococcaceae bacterium]
MSKPHHHTNRAAKSKALWIAWLGVWVLAGCSTITTHKSTGEEIVMTREEFEQYVEHVFRYHNQVMSELIESAEDRTELSVTEARQFTAAEKNMDTACEPLNEVVSKSLSGENVGLKLKMDLVDAVPACEEASKVVDDLLP